MAWWSTAWERLRPGISRDEGTTPGDGVMPGPAPSPATTVQRRTDWTTLPAMPRTIGAHPLVAPLDPFTAVLPTQRSPAFLAPLEHVVSPDGGGVVDGLATVATESPSAPVSGSNPSRAAATPAAVQRWAVEPDLVLSEVSSAAVVPARERAVPSTAPSVVGAVGDSLVRAPDPAPLRELPVVARLVDPTGDATPTTRPAPPAPHRPEPQQSAASPDLPVVSRSVADTAGAPDLSGVAPFTGMTTIPVAPQQVSSPEVSPGSAVPADRTGIGPSGFPPLSPAVTAVQRAVRRPEPSGPAPLPLPTAASPAAVHRAADAGPVLQASGALPPRPTSGLGAPLNDVDAAPVEPAPVAVGFAAFPFGDTPAEVDHTRADSPWPAPVVARSAEDVRLTAPVSAATNGDDAVRPGSRPEVGPLLAVAPLPAASPAPADTAQRSMATDSAATDRSPLAAVPPLAATDLSIVDVRPPAVTLPTVLPVVSAGSMTAGGSAGEAAVRAGAAQRAIDGSYVFAPPVPSSPVETTGLTTTHVSAPTGAGTLPLRTTAPASGTGISTVPVAQRLWGSDALHPGALVDQARDAVPALPTTAMPTTAVPTAAMPTPALPTPALSSSLPHLPDAPSLPSLPSLPAMPAVPGLPSVPSVPGLPTVPAVPTLPTMPTVPALPSMTGGPGLPTLPAVADGLPALPGVPSLPLAPTVPTLAAPTVATLPALPSVPSMPSLPGMSGPGLPGVPAAPTFPALGAGPTSWPVGPGGGVDHPVPMTPLDGVINSTVPGPDSGVSRRVDHPLPGEAERVINSTVSAPGTAPERPTPPTAAASAGPATAAGAHAVAGGAVGGAAAAPGLDIDDLARRLIDPISARLRTELWLDRERAGLLTDL